jgi:magnesium-transporting ATPase (P-type)
MYHVEGRERRERKGGLLLLEEWGAGASTLHRLTPLFPVCWTPKPYERTTHFYFILLYINVLYCLICSCARPIFKILFFNNFSLICLFGIIRRTWKLLEK